MAGLKRKHERRGPLDWEPARARLATAAAANDAGEDSERTRRILEERARALARPLHDGARVARLELLHFALGREHYAIETRFVCEVMAVSPLTKLPGAPAPLRGVLNLRGEILPVFDLGWLGAATEAAGGERQRLLVLGLDAPELGVHADAVHEIAWIETARLMTAAASGADGAACLRGVTPDAWSVLDGAALLADPRLWIGSMDDSPNKEATR
jgi:purine-binding chemotaxis protein CheW